MKQIIAWRLESVSVCRLRQHPMKRISKLEQGLCPSCDDGLRMQVAHGLMTGGAGYARVQGHKYATAREKMRRQAGLKRGVDQAQLLSAGCGSYGFLNSAFYRNTKSLGEWGAQARQGLHPTWMGQTPGREELSIAFYSPLVREQMAAAGMKYGMFFGQDRHA